MDSAGLLLARDVVEATGPIRRRHIGDFGVPDHPCGVLAWISAYADRCSGADVVDGLYTLQRLRIWLAWLELKHLDRAALVARITGVSQERLLGDILGIKAAAIALRRRRLPAVVAGRTRPKPSPRIPPIDRPAAAAAAAQVVARRVGHVEDNHPDPEDQFGVLGWAWTHRQVVPLDEQCYDVRDCVRLVAALRRELPELELRLLNLGRQIGVSNRALGEPFGRSDPTAVWKARRRLANGTELGGSHTVNADHRSNTRQQTAAPGRGAGASALRRARGIAVALLSFHDALGEDEDLDEWLRWLRDDLGEDEAISQGTLRLLWLVLAEVEASAWADTVEGLPGLLTRAAAVHEEFRHDPPC